MQAAKKLEFVALRNCFIKILPALANFHGVVTLHPTDSLLIYAATLEITVS